MKAPRPPLIVLCALSLALAASSALAADQYIVRVPANVNLVAPETPAPPLDPISVTLSDLALPAGMVGQPYTFNLANRLTLAGGNGEHNDSEAVWSMKAGDTLPAGLALSGGTISGTPTVKNTTGTPFEVTATYKDASGKQVYTIVVNGVPFTVQKIYAGYDNTCVITLTGGVKCWGSNSSGELGDGTTIDRMNPVDVSDLSGVVDITSGKGFKCALLGDGGVKCWGSHGYGQLGIGTTVSSVSTPTYVQDLTSGAVRISSGYQSSCALMNNGAVKCWGRNNNGQLGNDTLTNSRAPVDVVEMGALAIDVSVGSEHACATTTSGGVKCWGYNGYGQLGDTTKTQRKKPVNVSTLSSGVSGISLGSHHSCALLTEGGVKCWGHNVQGRLGDGTTTDRASPVDVTGLGGGVVLLESGTSSNCVIMPNGSAKCWGYDGSGQLGDDAVHANKSSAVNVSELGSSVVDINVGDNFACAVLSSNLAKCWGQNNKSQLGDSTTINKNVPVEVQP